MIVGFTGHRPLKLGGYSEAAKDRLLQFTKGMLIDLSPDEAIVGMALGFDTAVGLACWELGIPFRAYIPFPQQADRWPLQAQYTWNSLRDCAKSEKIFKEEYSNEAMYLRNQGIVDDSQLLIALYDGTHGGTAHAVNYAKTQCKKVVNWWPQWKYGLPSADSR